jgi:hypothetical protein
MCYMLILVALVDVKIMHKNYIQANISHSSTLAYPMGSPFVFPILESSKRFLQHFAGRGLLPGASIEVDIPWQHLYVFPYVV